MIRLNGPVSARRIRLVILDAPACPAITEVALFHSVAPVPFTAPRSIRYLRLTFAATAVPAAKLAIADVGAFVR